MSVQKRMHIIVDHREHKLKELLDMRKDKITYESKQLDVADVVVSSDVAIERKEGFDFISSITDNRLFDQLERLKSVYPNPILILEGLNQEVFENTGLRKASIYGVLAKISYQMGIAIIPTLNIEDTVIAIERIAFREQIKNNSSVLSRKAPKEMTKKERRAYIIEGLIDIGPKKAQKLIEIFKTPYEVFRAIKNTKILYTKTGRPKGIEGPLNQIPGFGWKFVLKNKEILFGKKSIKSPQLDLLKSFNN
ncbi:MAG: ERCC4 domain-containing protein [Promethearchaeota archaeon]